MRLTPLLFVALFMAGCAGVPQAVDQPVSDPAPEFAQAQQNPERHRDETVRWGGTIVGVENARDRSIVEIVARPLRRDSRPNESGVSPGRFLLVTPDFLDPEIYKSGRAITVTGRLGGIETGQVGEYDYPYPVVRASGLHLWEPLPDPAVRHYDPYWDDPWMRPWWYDPWHPYWRHHRRW